MATKLPPHHYALLEATAALDAGATVEQLAAQAGTDQSLVMAAAQELSAQGIVAIDEQPFTELALGPLGEEIARGDAQLPERALAQRLHELGGAAGMKDLSQDAKLKGAGIVAGKFAKNLATLGWASFDKGTLTLIGGAVDGQPPACALEEAITRVHVAGGQLELPGGEAGTTFTEALSQGRGRKELLVPKERSRRSISVTEAGQKLLAGIADGSVAAAVEANELTPEMLADGKLARGHLPRVRRDAGRRARGTRQSAPAGAYRRGGRGWRSLSWGSPRRRARWRRRRSGISTRCSSRRTTPPARCRTRST